MRLSLVAGIGAGLLLASCSGARPGLSQPAASTPEAASAVPSASASPSAAPASQASVCSGKATPAQTEGPYFKAGSPARATLVESGMAGTRLVLSGQVLTIDCKPVAGAILDFWQADAAGVYDNSGYRLRGHQATSADGRYSLDTIVPGEYPGRTQHIHVKVQAAGGPVLTTQLYFPDVARNQQDSIFNSALLVDEHTAAGGMTATFDFVLDQR